MIGVDPARRLRAVLRGMWGGAPYYASLALRLPLSPDSARETIATDGERLYYSPEWVADAPADTLREAMAGCVVGCVLKHHTRRGERDYARWQRAHHEVVRPILRADGLADAEGGLDMSIEAAYDLLPVDPPQDSPSPSAAGVDPNGRGEMMDCPRPTDGTDYEAAKRAAERDWDGASHVAAQQARAEGHDPGDLAAMIVAGHERKVDYLALLRRFMLATARTDVSWSRPNRRFAHLGIYLPEPHAPAMPPVVFAMDVSGSVNDEELNAVYGEIRQAVAETEPESVTLIQADSAVTSQETFGPLDLPEDIDVVGRGGTAFAPTFEAIADLPAPACVIYYTDLECTDYGDEPPYPVLWLVTGTHKVADPPFGEVVRIAA